MPLIFHKFNFNIRIMASDCRQPFTTLKVEMNGNVYGCANGRLIGNLNSSSAIELWNGDAIREIRRRLTVEDYDSVCYECCLYNNKLKNNEQLQTKTDFKKLKKINQNYYLGKNKIISKNKAYGFIDNFIRTKEKTFIEGWVIDQSNMSDASYIIFLVNSVFFFQLNVNKKRPDVENALKRKIKNCGFSAELPFISIEKRIDILVFNLKNEFLGELSLAN
jgi:radical SAM protein with 4Fe4S-binding SPASM domain